MNCAKIRELLITDYIDGELGKERRAAVAGHLRSCPGCAQFERELKEQAVLPFKSAERKSPPDYVWGRIRTAIINEPRPAARPAFTRRLKPALALSAVAALILAVVIVARPHRIPNGTLNIYLAEQAEFLADSSLNGTNISGFGTSIEEYFLS